MNSREPSLLYFKRIKTRRDSLEPTKGSWHRFDGCSSIRAVCRVRFNHWILTPSGIVRVRATSSALLTGA